MELIVEIEIASVTVGLDLRSESHGDYDLVRQCWIERNVKGLSSFIHSRVEDPSSGEGLLDPLEKSNFDLCHELLTPHDPLAISASTSLYQGMGQ